MICGEKSGYIIFVSNTMICESYVYCCLVWKNSKPKIDKVLKYFDGDVTSYNCYPSKIYVVSELFVVDLNMLYYGLFHFSKTWFIPKVLEATEM